MRRDHLFHRFRKANKLIDLVTVLYVQHRAGRRVTERIMAAASGSLKSADERMPVYFAIETRGMLRSLAELVNPAGREARGFYETAS